MEAATWVGAVAAVVTAVVAAVVAIWQARSARSARDDAKKLLDATKEQADAAKEQAKAVAQSVAVAQQQLEVARRQAGTVGQVTVEWVGNWLHGPHYGLLRLEAQGHVALHGVHMRLIQPRGDRSLSVGVIGSVPVDPSANPPVLWPTVEDPDEEPKVDVEVGDLEPGQPWHAQVMCASAFLFDGIGSFAVVLDWTVGSPPEREDHRADLPLPPPSPPGIY